MSNTQIRTRLDRARAAISMNEALLTAGLNPDAEAVIRDRLADLNLEVELLTVALAS